MNYDWDWLSNSSAIIYFIKRNLHPARWIRYGWVNPVVEQPPSKPIAYTHCLCLRFGAEKLTWRSPTVVEENWDKVALALGFLHLFWRKKTTQCPTTGTCLPCLPDTTWWTSRKRRDAHYKNLGSQSFYTPKNEGMSPKMVPFKRKDLSSNHYFSGDMLVFLHFLNISIFLKTASKSSQGTLTSGCLLGDRDSFFQWGRAFNRRLFLVKPSGGMWN